MDRRVYQEGISRGCVKRVYQRVYQTVYLTYPTYPLMTLHACVTANSDTGNPHISAVQSPDRTVGTE